MNSTQSPRARMAAREQRIADEIDEALGEAIRDLDDLRAHVRNLRKARKDVAPASPPAPGWTADEARRIAGPAAISQIAKLIRKHGRVSQASLTRMAAKSSGTTTWALRYLEADGVIRDTGERARGSRVVAWCGPEDGDAVRIDPGAATSDT